MDDTVKIITYSGFFHNHIREFKKDAVRKLPNSMSYSDYSGSSSAACVPEVAYEVKATGEIVRGWYSY